MKHLKYFKQPSFLGSLLIAGVMFLSVFSASVSAQSNLDSVVDKAQNSAKKFCANLYKGDKNESKRSECRAAYVLKFKDKCRSQNSSKKKYESCLKKKTKEIKKDLRVEKRQAAGLSAGKVTIPNGKGAPGDYCGSGENQVAIKFNIGCVGDEYEGDSDINPIVDMFLALIRFLSFGVGVLVVASIIYAGILYSSSQGSPEQTAQAKERIQNSVIALVFYIFIFAIIQWLVPGGVFV
jgi:hypothetical protein